MTRAQAYLTGFLILSLAFRFVRLRGAIRKAREARGRTVARPIFWVMAGSYLIYIGLCAWEGFRVAAFSFGASLIGLGLFVGSLILRERAMKDLGRFFSPDIEIRQEHRLIREGLYRYLRHPLLACMAMEVLGLGLVFNAYRVLLVIGFGVYLPLIGVRKSLEEKTLLKNLGDEYRVYRDQVGAFIPRMFPKEAHRG